MEHGTQHTGQTWVLLRQLVQVECSHWWCRVPSDYTASLAAPEWVKMQVQVQVHRCHPGGGRAVTAAEAAAVVVVVVWGLAQQGSSRSLLWKGSKLHKGVASATLVQQYLEGSGGAP